ncbi:hypothetical protein GCM10017784_35420 [Deinococcus indicus]|uniref:hypothetical protein n=1 Tax=Deinococcus indicus TaxID=223556 RepID=UPI0017488B53|nr:hypothetical protein [Deinococcus indicus]GHG37844.1 hypothetical protein GCM10017784_35420 [Deinococcus indicus]
MTQISSSTESITAITLDLPEARVTGRFGSYRLEGATVTLSAPGEDVPALRNAARLLQTLYAHGVVSSDHLAFALTLTGNPAPAAASAAPAQAASSSVTVPGADASAVLLQIRDYLTSRDGVIFGPDGALTLGGLRVRPSNETTQTPEEPC